MPKLTWDHIHLRTKDVEGMATWLQNMLGGEVIRTMQFMDEDNTVYLTMNGPNEFFCIGTLKNWSVVDRVNSISVPTLLLSGRYDEATPACVQPFFDGIPDVRWEIFEESSHMPFVEERDRYMSVVNGFLNTLE